MLSKEGQDRSSCEDHEWTVPTPEWLFVVPDIGRPGSLAQADPEAFE